MKSIGQAVKEARLKKKLSYQKLENITKIRKEFIKAIERQDWNSLPEFPVLSGFVKNIASALQINSRFLLALLRRDYPPKDLRINPKPQLRKEFRWSPRLTFILGVAIVTVIIFGYLVFQYISFISPPRLFLETPNEGQVITKNLVTVSGTTDPEATIKVNNQPALVEQNGYFTTEIEIFEGTVEIVVVAKSRSGKETVIKRKIKPELEK